MFSLLAAFSLLVMVVSGMQKKTKVSLKEIDVNGSGWIDKEDLNLVIAHFGAQRGGSNYVKCLDLNRDGVIDMKDVSLVAAHLGEKVPGSA